ncbi:MAG: VanZ family protein [Cytophagales bacterium]|nr:VanZ family protein [Cytophagales bacterium]
MLLKYNFYTICWALVILILSVVASSTNANIEISLVDKLVHAGMYATLAFFMIVGFLKQRSQRYIHFNAIRLSIIVCTSYGLLIEVMQSFLQYRTFDLWDLLANTVGTFIGWGLFIIIYKL